MYGKVIDKNCNFVNLSTAMKFKYLFTHECKLLGAFISNCWNIKYIYYTPLNVNYNMIQSDLYAQLGWVHNLF